MGNLVAANNCGFRVAVTGGASFAEPKADIEIIIMNN
jgi:hypothetical protein